MSTSRSFAKAPTVSAASGVVERRQVLSVGEVLNETFEVRALLGEGGMGQVFEAHDLVLNRRVAIKVMWPHVAASIRDEARALAALRHPCMAAVYSVGNHCDVEYLVMELIHGASLSELIDSRRAEGTAFELDEALRILAGVADGLGAVHRAGIAHRDVKPANVMVAPDDRLVLMDFGIFQSMGDQSEHLELSGSPPYMAPEVVANDVQPGELFLADVYSFGVLAFELLTGRAPFRGSVAGVFSAHLSDPVPDIAQLRPDVPPRLTALVRELLEKRPEDRPQSMEAVAWRVRDVRRRASIAPPRRLTVLIAEDDEANVVVMKSLVQIAAPEAEVLVARNGREAIDALRRHKPHLLLLDLHMPRMSGVEVCMYVNGLPPGGHVCTIVAVSADADARDVDLLRRLGVARYIPKGDALREHLPALIDEAKRKLTATADAHPASR